MKSLLLLVFAVFVAETRVSIDDKISVMFPAAPEKNQMADQVYYMYATNDVVYNAAYTDLKKLSSGKMQTTEQRNKIYEGFIKGALEAAAESRLLAKKDFQFKQYHGKEITYTKRFNGSNVKIVKRIFMVNRRLYQFEIWALNGQIDNNRLSAFFSSIQIKG